MPRARLGTVQQQRPKTPLRSLPWHSKHLVNAAVVVQHHVELSTRQRYEIADVMLNAAGAIKDLRKEINLLRMLLRGMTARATRAEKARAR